MEPCLCGDPDCWSCGRAQGTYRDPDDDALDDEDDFIPDDEELGHGDA